MHPHKIGGGGGGAEGTDINTIGRKTTSYIICIFKPDRCWDRLFTFHRFFGTDFLYEIVHFGVCGAPSPPYTHIHTHT